MRPIKFRAWHIEFKKYTKPDYITCDGRCYDGNLYNEYDIDENYILEQFTGIYDKKGKEIYEGDSIICGTICFYKGSFGVLTEEKRFIPLISMKEDEFEIVGNIHFEELMK